MFFCDVMWHGVASFSHLQNKKDEEKMKILSFEGFSVGTQKGCTDSGVR